MDLPAPLEPTPSFGELSFDELRHRYAKGILTPEELVRDSVANLCSLLPYGGLRLKENIDGPSMPRRPGTEARLHAITFVSPLVPGLEIVLTDAAVASGAIQVGQTVVETGHHPLDPTQLLTGPWAGGAIALLGWAAPLAIGVDEGGDLARMVLRTGIPGFRTGSSHGSAAPGWLFGYLVDAAAIAAGLTPETPEPGDSHRCWQVRTDSEEAVRPILAALKTREPVEEGIGTTIWVKPLTLESADFASRQNLAAAYIPWRWGGPESSAFQLLAPEGSEAVLAVATRHLAGPASMI